MTTKKTQEATPEVAAESYTKAQFMASKQFKGVDKDILSIALVEGNTYTVDEAQKAIEGFKNKEVK